MKLRMPMRPLVRLVTLAGGPTAAIRRTTSDHRETSRLYALYRRGERAGLLTVRAADELAVRLLGLHPALVWGDAWWAIGEGRDPLAPAAPLGIGADGTNTKTVRAEAAHQTSKEAS